MLYCGGMQRANDPFPIKICGLSTPETLEAALAGGADMIGLNFHPRSPRLVTPERARELVALAKGRAEIVALVVDLDPARAAELAAEVGADWLQLHGGETPEQVAATRSAAGRRVMKALGVAHPADLAALSGHAAVADLVLLDAKPPKDAAYPGGHGRPFDWSILAELDRSSRFMLSGGLTAANVAEAIGVTRPAGVDVSSGVESAPGVKDVDRIRDFIAAARRAAQDL